VEVCAGMALEHMIRNERNTSFVLPEPIANLLGSPGAPKKRTDGDAQQI
jgi:hypothetical protein